MSKDSSQGREHKIFFLSKLIAIFESNIRDERVTIPLMKTIEMLLSSDYLSDEGMETELIKIHALAV